MNRDVEAKAMEAEVQKIYSESQSRRQSRPNKLSEN